MLIILPISFYLLVFLHLMGGSDPAEGEPADWRLAALEAAVIWGGVAVVSAELLSLFQAITQLALAIVWGTLAGMAFALTLRSGSMARGWERCLARALQLRGWGAVFVGVMAFFASVLLCVGLITPPSNTDSLVYHMARVMHWAENQSLSHYAAVNHSQLMRPYWSELSILHLRVLWGSDSPAKLVQWFSMIGAVLAASRLVAMFGAGRPWQILGGAAVMSIPMGILQSTSTQNDYTSAFWAMCFACFVVSSRRRKLSTFERLIVAGSVGLGVLTKGTFFVYSLPFLFWYFLPTRFRPWIRGAVADGVLVGGVVVALNLGLWTRNIATYGGPYGPSDALQRSLGIKYFLPEFNRPAEGEGTRRTEPSLTGRLDSGTWSEAVALRHIGRVQASPTNLVSRVSGAGLARGSTSPGEAVTGLVARVLRMAGWNLVTPSSEVNSLLREMMSKVPSLYDENYLVLLQRLAWNHEDTASNPLHLGLVPLSLIALAVTGLRTREILALQYAGVVLATYALLPIVVSAAEGPWGIRYQLSFFVLWGPVVGIALASVAKTRTSGPITALFLLLVVPYLLFNNTRPIIGHRPWPTRTESILVADQTELMLAVVPEVKVSFVGATDVIKGLGCTQVGLRLNSSDLEYAYWWLMGAPQNGVKMENLHTYPVLERYVDTSFKPCAIICTICGERSTLHGLPLVAEFKYARVFAGSAYTYDEGD